MPGQESRGNGRDAAGGVAPPSAVSEPEIELKLAGVGNALETLWASTVAARTRATSRHEVSTYFDTSDLRLRRRGFTLLVRQVGDDFVQIVEAAERAASGRDQQREWSSPIDGPTPDLAKLDAPEVLEKIGLVVAGELQPIFTTDVTRHTKRFRVNRNRRDAALIEAALDRGEIRCNGRSEGICEIGLGLLEGSTRAVQREAVRYLEQSPLQYQPLSTAERGFALAFGEHPKGKKAVPPRLGPRVSVDEGLERVMNSCMNHWLANHAAVLDGRDIEGVHQMRVALRRMRSALTILKSALPEDDRSWLNAEAKALIGDLGGARDWDVFVEELLQPIMDARPDDASLDVLKDAVNEQRRLAYERARATLRSPRYLRFMLELRAWLDGHGWRRKETRDSLDRELIDLADEVLAKRHKQSKKLGRKFDTLSDEALHRLRISLKKLRYATEFFGDLYGKERTQVYLSSLRQLQDDLGHLNDVAVAETRLAGLYNRFGDNKAGDLQLACGTVIGWYSQALAQIRPRIAEDWYAFTRARPFWEGHRDGV